MTDSEQDAGTVDRRVCIDLFAGLGGFSQAFREADDWDVYEVEIREDFGPDLVADIMDLRPADLLELVGVDRDEIDVLVILASPPCTEFSTAGNHDHWDMDAHDPVHPDAREAVALVHHTVGLIEALAPDYWYLENPFGRMRWVLGEPTGKVTYCQYGRPYMKRTDLWGDHAPMTYRTCQRGGTCHEANVEYDGTSATRVLGDTAEERSKVPEDLSEAILEAVEEAVRNPPPEQTKLVTDGGVTEGLDWMYVAREAREMAYAPHSGHQVGAVLRTDKTYYRGANIEVSGRITSVHAEMMAAYQAVLSQDLDWKELVVTERPCAACAHSLAEWADDTLNIRMPGETFELGDLLGESYRPGNHDLGGVGTDD